MGRDEEIEQRAGANLSEFMEHGPGLRRTTRHWILKRCPNGHVLLGGLGGMGVGTMWSHDLTEEIIHSDGSRTAPYSEDPTYAEAPVDGTGCTVCHPFNWSRSVWQPERVDSNIVIKYGNDKLVRDYRPFAYDYADMETWGKPPKQRGWLRRLFGRLFGGG